MPTATERAQDGSANDDLDGDDEIALRAGLRSSQASAYLLGLEMKGLLRALPGKQFALA